MEGQCQTILEQIDGLLRDGCRDDHPLVNSLKQGYNQIMEKMYNEPDHVSRDMMDVFPSEVSSQVISEALTVHGYASALLLLTTVSSRWMLFLESIPTLWSQLEICGWEEDSMAIIQTFKHLSRNAPLRLVICTPIRHDLATFRDILQSISARLHQVIIVHGTHDSTYTTALYSALEALFNSKEHIKGVESIILYPDISPLHSDPTALRMTDASLPSNLRRIKGWCFHEAEMEASKTKLQCMEELETCIHLDDMLARASDFPLMRRLNLIQNSYGSRLDKGVVHAGVFHLTTLWYKNNFTVSLMGLLSSIAPSLLELDLRVPVKEIGNTQTILDFATRLRRLSLDLDEWPKEGQEILGTHSSHINTDPSVNIKSLRTLELLIYDDTAAGRSTEGSLSAMKQLLIIFNARYTDLEVVKFRLEPGSDFVPLVIEYFAQQPLLRICSLRGVEKPLYQGWDKIVILPALEQFHCNIPVVFEHLRLPCLHSLAITWYEIYERDDIMGHLDNLSLSISAREYEKPVKLPPSSFPSLERLALDFGRYAGPFTLNPFHVLTSISIITDYGSYQATALCLAVIYDPEACPSLKEMDFQRTPPEWDILFIMLETRNFLKTGAISRIRRMTAPLIPYPLRAPLASLLRGLFTQRPPNKEISFEAVREVMFDVNVVGCCRCLRNMISSCTRTVEHASFWGANPRAMDTSIFSVAEFPPPPSVEPHVRDWMEQRESLMQVWNLFIKEWHGKHFRQSICSGRLRDTPVEITEYDALMKDTS